MDNIVQVMLEKYHPSNNVERENAVKEIIQEIVLAGLSRGGFFSHVAFYGGTCLRIFYGLNRFSEDLDFALIDKSPSFNMEDYFPFIEKELVAHGINMDIAIKSKSDNADVQTAFVKGNTLMLFLQFFPNDEEARHIVGNQKIKIKFEIDIDNPRGGRTETKYQLLPSPYEVKVFDESTLFAGKIHAIICRDYKNHVKGRDYYDYLFYCGKGTKINLLYLENKLKNTGIIKENETLTLNKVKEMLRNKFNNIDYESAKEDVSNFINNKESLNLWSKELFLSTLDKIH
ncbi:MAG: nucleotidyl transferase AbiEii/AbiGii toxin family protein [Bacilli bacterium]|nr:nucleotidyl transferase AbiEii/AbiGii toxin family protein [Bacilli bacterium]